MVVIAVVVVIVVVIVIVMVVVAWIDGWRRLDEYGMGRLDGRENGEVGWAGG